MRIQTAIPSPFVKLLVFASLALGLMLFAPVRIPALHAADNAWTPVGLYGATVQTVVVDPTNNQVIYAGMRSPGSTRVFKSIDGGVTWTALTSGIGQGDFVWDLAIDPSHPNTIYAGTNRGVYKSTDGGGQWVQKTSKNSPFVVIHPLDGSLLALDAPAIARSKDGGETWETLGSVSASNYDYCVLAMAPSAPHILYYGNQMGGVSRSTDGGSTWQRIDSSFGASPSVLSLFVDPHDAQVVYLGVSASGLFKTTNGGQNWTPIGSGLGSINVNDIQVDPRNQQVMYAAGGLMGIMGVSSFGVFRSLDNAGLSWAAMNDGMGSRPVISLAIDNSTPQNLYAATDNGVWKYTVVSGQTDFSVSINEGALFTNQTSVTLTLTAPSTTSQVLISNDGGFGGAAWEPFASTKPWTITAYGNAILPRTVYAKFMTNGTISGQYQDDIILDQVAPTGSVQITAPVDALRVRPRLGLGDPLFIPFIVKDYTPGTRSVGLALDASDDFSGVDRVLISNLTSFDDAKWQTYATKLNWNVYEHGTTTVYVKFRDRAGNDSPVYTASTTAP